MKTVLITGCSSGFGLEIARYFLARDWQVVATMRTPSADVLPPSEHLRVLALDVRDPESIRKAVEAAGPIDVLVNNAGFGAASPAELVPMATVREIFETNTFGTIALTQAVLPQFRQRKAGVVVNVTSSVTLKALPLIAAYRASKAAVNAFTESMALELEQFGVRARLVLPGRAPDTRVSSRMSSRGSRTPLHQSPGHRMSRKPCGARRRTRHRQCAFRPALMPKHGRLRFADRAARIEHALYARERITIRRLLCRTNPLLS
jgi:NAD(P)-dependent dehydrogenase (short-subunit alcohol dehydrogenase family)